MSTLDEITKEKERIGEALARVACLAGKAGKHYCRSRRITPSVEKWRHEHPHDTPPYPCVPSPTSAISSAKVLGDENDRNRCDQKHSIRVKARTGEFWQTYPRRGGQRRKVD